jgi:hypothetical protein
MDIEERHKQIVDTVFEIAELEEQRDTMTKNLTEINSKLKEKTKYFNEVKKIYLKERRAQ